MRKKELVRVNHDKVEESEKFCILFQILPIPSRWAVSILPRAEMEKLKIKGVTDGRSALKSTAQA